MIDVAPRERFDHECAGRKVAPPQHRRALGLRIDLAHACEERERVVGAVLAREHERDVTPLRGEPAQVGERRVGIRPRPDVVVGAVPPFELAGDHDELVGVPAQDADQPARGRRFVRHTISLRSAFHCSQVRVCQAQGSGFLPKAATPQLVNEAIAIVPNDVVLVHEVLAGHRRYAWSGS